MRIEVICTGDEVLGGKTVNTNFAYISQRLEDVGLAVAWETTVGDDRESLGRVLDELLAARPEPPAVLALGEPTHGIEAFPLLRNDFLSHLVDRGFRSIALETDIFAASIVGAKGSIHSSIQSGLAPVCAGARHAASIIS